MKVKWEELTEPCTLKYIVTALQVDSSNDNAKGCDRINSNTCEIQNLKEDEAVKITIKACVVDEIKVCSDESPPIYNRTRPRG